MAAGDLRLYDPDQVLCTVAGIPLSGWADDDFVQIEYESDAFTDKAGVDGEVSRSKTNDFRATVTIRLMQTSPSNALLSVLHNSDKNTPGGVGVGPFYLQDFSDGITGALYLAEKCWIAKAPDSSWAREAGVREWKIRCAKLDGAGKL
jgi:hypothetical protein